MDSRSENHWGPFWRLAAVTDDAPGESGARASGAAAAAHGVGAAGDGCRRLAGRAPAKVG